MRIKEVIVRVDTCEHRATVSIFWEGLILRLEFSDKGKAWWVFTQLATELADEGDMWEMVSDCSIWFKDKDGVPKLWFLDVERLKEIAIKLDSESDT